MTWDDDSGDWQGLASRAQLPRYWHIARLIAQCSPRNVLDVGCGEAILRDFLPSSLVYSGVEPSSKAANAQQGIVHTTAEAFSPGNERWDCIVFNEVLYYSHDPLYLLKKYARLLVSGGRILISIYQKPGIPSFKSVLLHWLNPNRPMSNLHCTQMLSSFIFHECWAVESDELVAGRWRVWLTQPRGLTPMRTEDYFART